MLARTDETDDEVGQAIAAITSAAEHLEQLVRLGNQNRGHNLDRMAHRAEIRMLSHAATQVQFVASLADCRRMANNEIAAEDGVA